MRQQHIQKLAHSEPSTNPTITPPQPPSLIIPSQHVPNPNPNTQLASSTATTTTTIATTRIQMDLSSLQNDLPRGSKPSPPPSLPPAALTADFKAAALAVTKLYQNSARQIDHARQEGYLAAVQEVAALLSAGEIAGDRLREWCGLGLSRITAQQDEENRTRGPKGPEEGQNEEETTGTATASGVRRERSELTPPASSPVLSSRMQLPLQNPFGETEFTFQSTIPGTGGSVSGYSSPTPFGRVEPEVTYEVIENGREGNSRKRGVNHQLGSIWDIGGSGGYKRSRHM